MSQYSGYQDPRVIGKDMADTFVGVSRYLRNKGEAFTSEDARKIALSPHIQADRNGYRGPVASTEEQPHGMPALAVNGQQAAQGAPQEAPPPINPEWQQPNEGYSYDSVHIMSEKQKSMIGDLKTKAIRVVDEINKKGPIASEKVVMKAISEPFKEQRGHEINLSSFTRMTSGDASWTIDFLQRTWEVR